MPRLFSYGTLQQDRVQRETFGRLLQGQPDVLAGFVVGEVRITDPAVLASSGKAFHPVLRPTGQAGDRVRGTVYEISPAELAQADDYEVDDYQRVAATLESGRECWIYVAADRD